MVRGETPEVRDAVFTELIAYAAYDPHRAIRTNRWKYIRRFDAYAPPVLPNCDDSPSKDALIDAGWARRPRPAVQLYDVLLDPGEARNLAGEPGFAEIEAELAGRLERWMLETS